MTGRELVRKTEELLNKRDKAGFLALQHPDIELLIPATGVTLKGPEAASSFAWAFIEAFPDGRMTTSNVVSEGDLTYAEQRLEGTHTAALKDPAGKMPAIPPTGKHVVIQAAAMTRIQDGLVKEVRIYMDNLAFMAQLGLVPAAATA